MPQVQGVAARQIPYLRRRLLGYGTAEHTGEQCVGLGSRQGLKVAPQQHAVLPQGGDGIRCRLPGPYRDDQPGSPP